MRNTIQSFRSAVLVPLLIVIISAGLVSFADKEGRHARNFCGSAQTTTLYGVDAGNSFITDTVPVDGISEKLEAALEKIEQQLRKLEKQIEEVGYHRAAEAYQKAVKDVDWKRIENAASRSLAQTHAAMDRAQQKMAREHKVELAELNQQLAVAGRKLAQHSRELAYDIERNVDVELRKVKKELKNVEGRKKDFENLVDDLAAEKLIDKDGKYSIQITDGDLFINGKKQPASLTKKYKKRYPECFKPGSNFNRSFNNKEKSTITLTEDDGLI